MDSPRRSGALVLLALIALSGSLLVVKACQVARRIETRPFMYEQLKLDCGECVKAK